MAAAQYLELTPCCDPTLVINLRPSDILPDGEGIYRYDGPTENGLNEGYCYNILIKTGTISYVNSLPTVDINDLYYDDAQACENEKCAPCPACYTLVNCDPQYPIIISNTLELEDYIGGYIKLFDDGLCYYVIKNESNTCPDAVEVNLNPEVPCSQCIPKCWYVAGNPTSVTYVTIENEVIITSGNIKVCSIIPPVVTGTNGSIINLGDCVNGECPELCFKLENCVTNEIIYSNTETLIQHIGNTVTLNGQEGCWQVGISAGSCDCITVTFTGPGGTEIYTANANGTYNGYNLYEFTLDGDNAYIYFEPGKGWYISLDGYGNSPSEIELAFTLFTGECPDSVNEGFTWYLGEVIFNSIETEVCPAECTCPIPVTVLQSFEDCPSCLPIIAYKFTNCNNQTLVQYSTEDYSAYVGKTVELECGGCWFVSQIDYTPPSTQTITILYTFDSCIACNRTYYKLTDCLDPNNVTYTYTDLSALFVSTVQQDCTECINVTFKCNNVDYSFDLPVIGTNDGKRRFRITNISICNYSNADIDIFWVQFPESHWSFSVLGTEISEIPNDTECPFGNYPNSSAIEVPFTNIVVAPCSVPPVIKIKGCDNCFSVEETRLPINAGIVELVDSFIDCPECLETFPCVCNTISNTSNIEQTYCYIDCSFEQQSITLQPQETSDKVCVIKWIVCPQTCDCVTGSLTANGETTTYEFLPTGQTYNGKPVYQDCFNSNPACDIPFPIDACYTIKYEDDNCWYASVTNNCETNIYQVFKKCSESACSTDLWEYIPCTRLGVSLPGEVPFAVVLSVNDYTADVFSYGNPTTGLYVAFNTAINQWEMSFDGEVFETLEEGLSPCDGTVIDPVIWGNTLFSPQTWDSNAPLLGPYEFTSEKCGGIVPVSDLNTAYIQFYGDCTSGDVCYNYTITIGSNTTAALYYKNCNGAVESQQILTQRNPYIITICGINNQTSSDIYIVGSGSMSFEKTTTCATQPFTCPAEPLPKRKVKPGYSTPSCDIEKYEKITCKSSEIYYKQVLRLRYGLSNCCPEDEEKWLVKKELIDLDALRDPDYVCQPVTSCCGQTINTCGCGCNQTLKTCNS